MGQAIAVRTDYSSGEVRRLAQRAKDAGQARRLLAIAAVLDGSSREEAARLGGMDRQTLRDWVIRFNEQGPEGLINIPSPGAPAKLTTERGETPAHRLSELAGGGRHVQNHQGGCIGNSAGEAYLIVSGCGKDLRVCSVSSNLARSFSDVNHFLTISFAILGREESNR